MFAQLVWKKFNCNTFKDYHDLYMKTYILLLTDVFENFRTLCLKEYELDPCYYYSAPNLAWDACLKLTGQRLELLTDQNMYLFSELGKRGGISQVCMKRYVKADPEAIELARKQLKSNELLISNEKHTYIMYYDANNLYGHSMSQPLPIGGFRWLDLNSEIGQLNQAYDEWLTYKDYIFNSDDLKNLNYPKKGYLIECDIVYPPHLHDLHNDLPFLPRPEIIDVLQLSKIQQEYLQKTKSKQTSKLITTLHDKKNYVLSHEHLFLAIS